MDKSKQIQLNLIKRSTDSSDNNQPTIDDTADIIYLDKNETFVIPLDRPDNNADCRLNLSLSDKENDGQNSIDTSVSRSSLDNESFKENRLKEPTDSQVQIELNNNHHHQINDPPFNRTNQTNSNQIGHQTVNDQLNQTTANQITNRVDYVHQHSNVEHQSNRKANCNRILNLEDEESNCSDMSISSIETASSMSIISKNFPEFFKDKPSQEQSSTDRSKRVDTPQQTDEPIPFLEHNQPTNHQKNSSTVKLNAYEYDKDDEISSLDIDANSIDESIDNLEPSIFDTLPTSSQLIYETIAQLDKEFSLVDYIDPGMHLYLL